MKSPKSFFSPSNIVLIAMSAIFGLLGLIPIVHFFTDAIYWVLWIMIMAVTKAHLLLNPKALTVALIGVLIGMLPFVGGLGTITSTVLVARMDK